MEFTSSASADSPFKDRVKPFNPGTSSRQRLRVVVMGLLILLPASRLKAQGLSTLHALAPGSTNSSGVYTNQDGAHPLGGVILSGITLYGTAQEGGLSGNGTVFAFNPGGSGFAILHSFSATSGASGANSDGAFPQAGLIASGNALFGTTLAGGGSGAGTVFALSTDGTGFTNLHSFTGPSANADGAYPYSGLVLSGSTLYGTTSEGGKGANGAIFAINTDGSGFRNLYPFTPTTINASGLFTNSDGAHPWAELVLAGNTLYGTASQGGTAGKGTVFALNIDGTGFTNLHNFTGLSSDGAYPYAGLILSGNVLYGTTEFGGTQGRGTVFAINTAGSGFTTLYSFSGGTDGAAPSCQLLLTTNTLYGTTQAGGFADEGAVFAINTDGSSFRSLYNFSGLNDGGVPVAGLVPGNGILYGTASEGGNSGLGTVFSISPASVSSPRLTIILSGPNVVLLWPADATGFTLQSTTDLVPPTVWSPVLIPPVLVNGQNAVTNPISATQQFFRLFQ